MSNDVSVFGGNVKMKSAAELAAAIKDQVDDAGGSETGSDAYISFSGQSGKYAIGESKRDTDPDELFIPNTSDFRTGYMCWKDGRPVAKRFSTIDEPKVSPPDENEFGPFGQGEGWSKAMAMTLMSVDDGTQYFFSTSSGSGVRAFRGLMDDVSKHLLSGDASWPVFTLSSSTFRGNGRDIPKPVFEIAEWLTDEQAMALLNDKDATLDSITGGSPAGGTAELEKPEPEVSGRRRRKL